METEVEQTEGEVTAAEIVNIPTSKPARGRKRVPPLHSIERRNWLIHAHFTRKEYETCKSLIQEQLKETNGQCEYAVYIQAMLLRTEGDIQRSLELFQACHLLNPKNPDNLKQTARNLVLLGKHKNAIDCYKKAAELSTMNWDISHSLGVCYHFIKQYEKAEEYYKQALSKNKHLVTFKSLAKLYNETEKPDKAMEILKRGVEFAPENTDLLTTLGLLFLRKNNHLKAFEYLGQALSFDPENYKAILATSSLIQLNGDFDVALTKYRVAANSVPESSSVWNNIAMCFFGKGKCVAAISCLKRANYFSPFDWRILYNLSLIHLVMGQHASAFQFASTAVTLKKDNGSLYMLLAVALTNLNETENAGKAYEKALEFSPTDHYLLLNYCIFLHNHSQSGLATKHFKKMLEHLPDAKAKDKDSELFDTVKKLGAALNVGDKIVASILEKPDKKKRKSKGPKPLKSDEKIPSEVSSKTTQPPMQSSEIGKDEVDGLIESSSMLNISGKGLLAPLPLTAKKSNLPPLRNSLTVELGANPQSAYQHISPTDE